MNRFLPFVACFFVGITATLVSSCARYVVSEPVLPPLTAPLPSAGLAYESGTAAGLRYGPLVAVQYGYYAPPPPDPYYGPPPEAYYAPPPGDDDDYYYPSRSGPRYELPHNAPLYGPPPGAR